METKKLSEALAELQKAASVEGLDVRLVVAGNSSTDNAKTITLQQLLKALNVPTVQTGVVGNNQQYVYSVSSDNTHAVMSGTFKAFQNSGQCLIRHKFWGSTNDYTDGQYTTCEIPKVSTGANGVFEAAMLVRLRNTTLKEINSTNDKVVISYPNYANGSTNSLEISKATTAKAGVMTAAQVSALDNLSSHIIDLGDYQNEDEALNKIGQLGICNNRNLVHVHLTYHANDSSAKTTLILIQSIEGKKCRQYIFNKRQVYTRLIHFTDESLSEHEFIEDFTFMFPDRLVWSDSHHGYLMSQFGSITYGKDYSDPIPYASTTACGLMSKEDKALLEQIKTKLGL